MTDILDAEFRTGQIKIHTAEDFEGMRRAGPQLGQNSYRNALQNLQFRPDVWAPMNFRPGVRQGGNVIAVLKEQGGVWALERDFTDRF